jgi:hypothetical protein
MMIGFVDYIVAKGLRPVSATEQIAEILAQLAVQHPGDAYDVTLLDNAPNPRPAPAALYLPNTGDGTLHLSDVGRVFDATLTAIVWQGNSVTAKAKMGVLGSYDFEATIDKSTGSLNGSLSDKKNVVATLDGSRVLSGK